MIAKRRRTRHRRRQHCGFEITSFEHSAIRTIDHSTIRTFKHSTIRPFEQSIDQSIRTIRTIEQSEQSEQSNNPNNPNNRTIEQSEQSEQSNNPSLSLLRRATLTARLRPLSSVALRRRIRSLRRQVGRTCPRLRRHAPALAAGGVLHPVPTIIHFAHFGFPSVLSVPYGFAFARFAHRRERTQPRAEPFGLRLLPMHHCPFEQRIGPLDLFD